MFCCKWCVVWCLGGSASQVVLGVLHNLVVDCDLIGGAVVAGAVFVVSVVDGVCEVCGDSSEHNLRAISSFEEGECGIGFGFSSGVVVVP